MSLYISPNGSDDINTLGTFENPFQTISYALSRISNETKITCLEGVYEMSNTEINIDGLSIEGQANKNVVFDGTRNIDELKDTGATWETVNTTFVSNDGLSTTNGTIYRLKIQNNVDIWQLFQDRNEIINARYPSAQWSDESVYDQSNNWGHGYYDSNTSGGSIPYSNGEMLDYPTTNTNLYQFVKKIQESVNSSFDLSGSMANLNVGSYKTFTRKISAMTLDDINNLIQFTYPSADLWKEKHHYYYLENKLEFLNSTNEWYFDKDNSYLYVRLNNDAHPNNTIIRSKVQTYALNLTNHNITVSNISFFGNTFTGNKNNLNINQCNFLYPNCYARSIEKVNYDNTDDSYDSTTMIKSGTNCRIYQCVFKYTDGIALEMWGGSNTLEDCYFSYIDKTVANLSSVMTSVRLNGSNNIVKNNTFYKTGASSTLNSGDEAIIEYNNLSNSGYLQSDGAMIHVMVNQQTNVKIRFNWCFDSIKYGIRFDGEGAGHTGYIHHNIVWNCEGAIMVKGGELDNGVTVGGHFIYNNTVFDSYEQGKNDIIALNEQSDNLINYGTVVMNNLGERIYGHRSNTTAIANYMYDANNYMPTQMEDVIQSFTDRDFRPLTTENNIINMGDTTTTASENYLSGLSTYNSDTSLHFNPGTGDDKLTSDIGAMNATNSVWKAGITWNTQNLYGSDLDTYITNEKLNMFTNQKVIYMKDVQLESCCIQ